MVWILFFLLLTLATQVRGGAQRVVKEFVYDENSPPSAQSTTGDQCHDSPPCVEYRWKSEIDNRLWVQRLEMEDSANITWMDGAAGARIEPMEISSWKFKPASSFDATFTLQDAETGGLIFISTTVSGRDDVRHYESSTSVSREDGERQPSYSFHVSPKYEDLGLVIEILITDSPAAAAATSDSADDVTDKCQVCRNVVKQCHESKSCHALHVCVEKSVGLETSLQTLAQLSPGSYFNITAATMKCTADARVYSDFINALSCAKCGSMFPVQTKILPGSVELLFESNEEFESRLQLKMGDKVCDENAVAFVKRTGSSHAEVNIDESIQQCLNHTGAAVRSSYQVYDNSIAVFLHIDNYIGPMPTFQAFPESIEPISSSVSSPELLFVK